MNYSDNILEKFKEHSYISEESEHFDTTGQALLSTIKNERYKKKKLTICTMDIFLVLSDILDEDQIKIYLSVSDLNSGKNDIFQKPCSFRDLQKAYNNYFFQYLR